ncbi:ankyrin repeat domain-containing protein 1 isoform X2 [Gouania willdenowi]|uniref:ankyrin repeat domain-containing protein 1 isoform X2 n=1 Tax=Gouania willdenowi TaxID=441366 RepID=UPI0010547A46|nr:ankyrin repeat domain-containing protein 1-like isoform X2 [Gouania willdenowi]
MDHNTTQVQAEMGVRGASENCEILEPEAVENTCSRKTSLSGEPEQIPKILYVDMDQFMNAARQGNLAVIKKYLSNGGNPNVHDELGRTALHRSSIEGHIEVVHMLLEKGADINLKDQLGSRAIHWACRGGNLKVLEALKSYGADLNATDQEGDTALHDAVRLNRYKIAKLLIASGVDTKIKNNEGLTAGEQVKQWQSDVMETLQ